MTYEVEKYCARAIIRHLNGNKDLFYTYIHKAMKIYENEKCIATVGELIDKNTKTKLYEMVS
jgi:hypothetical protein